MPSKRVRKIYSRVRRKYSPTLKKIRKLNTRVRKSARHAQVSLRKSSSNFLRQVKGGLSAAARTSIKWIQEAGIWVRVAYAKLVFYFVGIVLAALMGIVLIGVVEFYRSAPDELSMAISYLSSVISLPAILYASLSIFLLWHLMGYLARNALIFLFFSQSLWLRPIDYLIKLLGSLPTLILGNAVIVVSNRLDFHPTVPMASMAFIVLALAITGLPTILQIGREVLKDYDPKQLQQALALGIGKPTIGKDIIIPGIRRSFNAGITIAISRIIIEGYIVINRMVFMEPGGDRIIRDPQDFLDIFYGLYSTVTIETNATLIVLLFIIALSVNFLSFRVMSGKLP